MTEAELLEVCYSSHFRLFSAVGLLSDTFQSIHRQLDICFIPTRLSSNHNPVTRFECITPNYITSTFCQPLLASLLANLLVEHTTKVHRR
jgi:hypothetical protein